MIANYQIKWVCVFLFLARLFFLFLVFLNTAFNLLRILNILDHNLKALKRACLFVFKKTAPPKPKISHYQTTKFLHYPTHNLKNAA